MALFLPTAAVERVTDITPKLVRSMEANTVLLDVDNTLALHGSQIPFPGTVEWAGRMQKSGIRIMIMSNNVKERVAPFAALYGLPFISMALKPLPAAYRRAIRKLGAERAETVAVGDQIFTDVVGANLARVKSILLMPAREERSLSFRIRRYLEKPVRGKIAKIKRKEILKEKEMLENGNQKGPCSSGAESQSRRSKGKRGLRR